MTPSPKNTAVPKMPMTISGVCSFGLSRTASDASASIAISPPSPLLSARRISTTYLSETTTVMVQNIIDSTP